MKRLLGIALILAVAMVLGLCAPVLAWELEDPEAANNEDFIAGGGFDDGSMETQSGAQPWPYYKAPNEGYNLYRDDVTDTGNLDSAFILTFTPDAVDLPVIASYGPYPKENLAEYWYVGDESPDTWYWATEPRGYDIPKPPRDPQDYISIVLPDDRIRVKRQGTLRECGDIDFNDGTWRIQIAAGVRIWRDTGGAATKLFVLDDGSIKSGIHFTCGEPIITRI